MLSKEQIVPTWVAMCVTAFRETNNLSLEQFLKLDSQYQLLGYLLDNYELLHYYGSDAVCDALARDVAEKGGRLGSV